MDTFSWEQAQSLHPALAIAVIKHIVREWDSARKILILEHLWEDTKWSSWCTLFRCQICSFVLIISFSEALWVALTGTKSLP